jgi:hypothetical protein
MKFILCLCLLAALAFGQTSPTPQNLTTVPAGAVLFGIGPDGKLAAIKIDASLKLTLDAGGALTLSAVVPAATSRRVTLFEPTVAGNTVTLPSDPKGPIDVSCNGFMLSESKDYTVAGRVLTFVARWAPRPGDLFRLAYAE